jgi:hypothetical protein
MKNGKKDFQEGKSMSKIPTGIAVTFLAFTTIYAAEVNDLIHVHACNTTWEQQTELEAKVFYRDQEEVITLSLILGGVSSETTCTRDSKFLGGKGNIKSISLTLRNYYEGGRDIIGTTLASLDVNLKSSALDLKEIAFEVTGRKIAFLPKYGNLPPKFEGNTAK